MKKHRWAVALVVAVALALSGVGVWKWQRERATVAAPPTAAAPPIATPVASAAPTVQEPAIKYPLDPAALAPTKPLAPDTGEALNQLFGATTVLSMFEVQDFAQHFVATVDNLGRPHATSRLWPVHRPEGRFLVESRAGAAVIRADNGLRYTPYVRLLENVDLRQATALYAQLYPQFQRAYEDLGFPSRYFNDRLVEVIDQLLAAPDSAVPPTVHLPAINGPLQPARPWVLYEFDDPALESLAAGQKIMLRLGTANESRVKARLKELRALLVSGARPK
jgi:hypothetical protein